VHQIMLNTDQCIRHFKYSKNLLFTYPVTRTQWAIVFGILFTLSCIISLLRSTPASDLFLSCNLCTCHIKQSLVISVGTIKYLFLVWQIIMSCILLWTNMGTWSLSHSLDSLEIRWIFSKEFEEKVRKVVFWCHKSHQCRKIGTLWIC
jgi:hypothetical protein